VVGEVAPVVGVVPVSVDDSLTAERGGFVDEVLASGERGDQGLQGEVVDRAGVAVCRVTAAPLRAASPHETSSDHSPGALADLARRWLTTGVQPSAQASTRSDVFE
jgi:hypothetical protein